MPLYVVGIRPADRAVVVGHAEDLDGSVVRLSEVNWLGPPLAVGDHCEVQVRYRSRAVPATVRSVGAERIDLDLLEPARAITPGQSGVMYSPEGRVYGGGVIE